jgi:DNA repair exonuclease SbcCD ATPase subunit
MASEYDPAEFIDSDFQTARKASHTGVVAAAGNRAPTRDEVDSKVGETQQKLAELRRVQEELERERAGLEETRRRQIEFQTGRAEALQNLTRGVGLLEEAEFAARRDAEQMAKTLADMRDALAKVEITNDAAWTKENFSVELTRALTTIENARMEWNAARLKFPVLSGTPKDVTAAPVESPAPGRSWMAEQSFGQLCKMGIALTWPIVVALVVVGLLLAVFLQPPYHH